MTFVATGLARPVAIVGDSLFAGSMGGGTVSYKDAVQNNLEKILTLPDETIICPGHGPMTSVGEEKKHNPFFVGKVECFPNDEARMTNDETSSNDQMTKMRFEIVSPFGFRHSFVLRHSTFVISSS